MPSPHASETAMAVRTKTVVSTRAKVVALAIGCAAFGLAAYGFGFIPDISENEELASSIKWCKSTCAQALQQCTALPKADVLACEVVYQSCIDSCSKMGEVNTYPQAEQLSDGKMGNEDEGAANDTENMEWRIVGEEEKKTDQEQEDPQVTLKQKTLFSMDGRPADVNLTVSAVDGSEVSHCNEGHEFLFRAAFRIPVSGTAMRYAWIRSDGSVMGSLQFTSSEPDQFYTDNYRERFSTSTHGVIGVRILAPVERTVTSTFSLDTNVCGSTDSSTEPGPSTESDGAASTIDSRSLMHVDNAPRTTPVTPDKWRSRAMSIPFTDFRREILSGNRLLVTSDQGRFGVVVPVGNADAEPFARYSLMKLKRDYENTEAILGVSFIVPGPIRQYFIIDPNIYRMRIGGLEEVDGIIAPAWYFPDEEAFSRYSNLALPENGYILNRWDQPSADHELVHRFVMGTDLSLMLDEGLANYIPSRVRGGVPDLDCRADGYVSGGLAVQPYFQSGEPFSARRIYDTGECFWWILHNTYGADAVTRVMRERLHVIQRGQDLEPDGPTPAGSSSLNRNIRRLLIPILGESVWSVFRGFGASPDGM